MKALSRAIDRFCQKNRRFGVPRLMLYIVITSAVVFLIGGSDLIFLLRFDPAYIMRGQIWRLITWIFLPLNNQPVFVLIALYFYYFIGSTLEREWGTAKFTIYYIFGVLLNIVFGFVMWLVIGMPAFPLPVSYILPNFLNLSMFFAFAVLFPDHVVRLFFIIPIKVKWLALINAGYFTYSIITELIAMRPIMALLPVVALLNFILICGNDLLSYARPLKTRHSAQTLSFRREAKKAQKENKNKPYRHQCAVCGKTDSDHPDLEFRYCSRCNGYHCFCIDHINNHIHFQ